MISDNLSPDVIAALVATSGGAISAKIISLLAAKSNRKRDSEIERLKDQRWEKTPTDL
jgi:hypothetical protein